MPKHIIAPTAHQILRELREMGVTVFFEKENIDTARSADKMMIAIMGGLAQEESQSISMISVRKYSKPSELLTIPPILSFLGGFISQ